MNDGHQDWSGGICLCSACVAEEEIRDVAEAVNKKGAATEFSDYETIQEPTIEHALRSIKEWMAQGFVPICKLYYIGMGGYYGFRCHMVKPK